MKNSRRSGFTLLELMIVLVILSILAMVVAPHLFGRVEQAKMVAGRVQIQNLEMALRLFYLDNGFYPDTGQGLKALVEKPTSGRTPEKWKEEGYLERGKVPLDPWGNEYLYISPGDEEREYEIISFGRDGERGGEGPDKDIESWNLEE